MRLSYILRLSLKNLKGYKMRTLLTIGGVAVSIGFISFLVSLGYGLQKISTDQIANIEDLQLLDVTVGKSRIVSLNDESIQTISNFSEVENIYPSVSVATDIELGSSKIDGVLYGKNINLLKVENPKLLIGKFYSATTEGMLNVTAARKLGISNPETLIGKEITVNMILRSDLFSDPKSETKTFEKTFKVAGILDEGTTSYVYIPLDVVTAEGIENFSAAKVKVKNKNMVDTVRLQLEHMGLKVTSIKDTVDQVNQFFGVFRVILIGFGAVAIFVACLGMFNTLTITLMEKTREVGIMKVLGMTKKEIWRIFICESLIIGLTGGIVGVICSYLIGKTINLSIAALATSSNNKAVTLFVFPVSFLLAILVLSFLIAFMTGVYPSRRATKISALNALRYE